MTDTPSDTLKEFSIGQKRGPTIEFTGRLLGDIDFEITSGRGAMKMTLEIYETRGGALVAVSASRLLEEAGFEDVRAIVIPKQDDVQAMQFAAMDFWTWETRARRMVQRKLKWSLKMQVE
jgi:hypothetical protein